MTSTAKAVRLPARLLLLALLALAPASLSAQDQEKDPPAVDQAAIDAAVARGAEWLRARVKEGLFPVKKDYSLHEIVLYALVHAGVDRGDPDLIRLVREIRARPPSRTYTTALRAMAFALYDPVKLRPDLLQCAEFLVNNQGENGQWGYGQPIEFPPLPRVTFTPSTKPPDYTLTDPDADKPAPAGASSARGGSAASKRKPPRQQLVRRAWGAANDNSNTQYALLGLSACMTEGLLPPPDCLPRAEEWWRKQRNDDGGWNYVTRGPGSTPNMTAGGVSSLSILLRETGRKPLKDPAVARGLEWLGKALRFDPKLGNLAGASDFYFIYALERAGAMAGTEWFGDHPWYAEGAAWLLSHQKADGAWDGDMGFVEEGTKGNDILDTCWAILFLRRATRHIVLKKIVYTR